MSEITPKIWEAQQSLWHFRDLLSESESVLEAACERGRMERWGHAARIPVWAEGDEVVLVVDGTVVSERLGPQGPIRLTRGDAFGPSFGGQPSTGSGDDEQQLVAFQETTICSISRDVLRQIWESDTARAVEAGKWFRKKSLSVPVWPLLGTLPVTRLARIILHLVEEYGEIKANRGRLPVALRARQLAQLAGISRSRTDRIWTLFEDTGLIQLDGGALVVSDLKTLRKYALGSG